MASLSTYEYYKDDLSKVPVLRAEAETLLNDPRVRTVTIAEAYELALDQWDVIETDMPIEKIEILNTLGKTVISTRNTKQISLSNLAAGFYTARITSPKGDYFIQKFVKK